VHSVTAYAFGWVLEELDGLAGASVSSDMLFAMLFGVVGSILSRQGARKDNSDDLDEE
jgi:hypothetical protein